MGPFAVCQTTVGACYLKSSSREIVSSVGPSGPQACVPHGEDTTAAVQKLLSIRPAPTPLTEALTLMCGSISKAHMAQVRLHFLSCHFLLGKSWGCPNSMSFLASLGWAGTVIHPGVAVPLRGGALLPAGTPELALSSPAALRKPGSLGAVQAVAPPSSWVGVTACWPWGAAPATEQPRGDERQCSRAHPACQEPSQ